MHTFADLAEELNRSTVYVSGLQSRFEIPAFDGAGYSDAYLAFLQTVVNLWTLSITEETLRDLWHIEMKLLQLLHADSTGSPTWSLDSCGATTSPKSQAPSAADQLRTRCRGAWQRRAVGPQLRRRRPGTLRRAGDGWSTHGSVIFKRWRIFALVILRVT